MNASSRFKSTRWMLLLVGLTVGLVALSGLLALLSASAAVDPQATGGESTASDRPNPLRFFPNPAQLYPDKIGDESAPLARQRLDRPSAPTELYSGRVAANGAAPVRPDSISPRPRDLPEAHSGNPRFLSPRPDLALRQAQRAGAVSVGPMGIKRLAGERGQIAGWVAPSATPAVTLSLTFDTFFGYTLPDATFTATLKSGATPKGLAVALVDGLGWLGNTSFFDQGRPVDIAPGDTADFFVNGTRTTATLPTITGNVDPATDVVSGAIAGVPLPANLTIVVHGRSRVVATDAAGNFTTDWTGIADIVQGDQADVSYEMAGGFWAMVNLWPSNGYTVYPDWNEVAGYTAPGGMVTVTIRAGDGTLKESGTATADATSGGWWYGAGVDIVPGDRVEVQAGGETLASTVSEIAAQVDVAADTVSGTGPAGSNLVVSFWRWEGTGSYLLERTVPTAPDGIFNADFSAEGLDRWRGWGYAVHADTPYADTAAWIYASIAQVNQTWDDIWGLAAPGAGVTITLTGPDGVPKAARTVTADPAIGYFQTGFDADVAPGDTVQVTGAGIAATVPIITLTAAADRTTDTVYGFAAPDASHLRVRRWNTDQNVGGSYFEQGGFASDASGAYAADLSAGVDLHSNHGGEVQYHTDDDPDEHTQAVRYWTPYLLVCPTYDWTWGQTSLPGVEVTLSLLDSTGATKATTTVTGDPPEGTFQVDWARLGADVEPGDRVVMDAGTFTDTVTVPDGGAVVDADVDLVTGTGPAWSLLELRVNYEQPSLFVPTDGQGRFIADFSGIRDIRPGDWMPIFYTAGDFNQVVHEARAPYARANIAWDSVDGWFGPGVTVWYTVTDGSGTYKGSGSGTPRADGWMEGVGCGCDIAPGDRVSVTSSTGFEALLVPIDITGQIDVDADLVSGQMFGGAFPADGYVEIWSPRGGGSRVEMAIDADGFYTADFSGRFDLRAGDEAYVWYIHPDGNHLGTGFYTPFLLVRANRTHDWVEGNASRDTNVVVRVLRNGEEIGRGESYTGGGTWFHVNPQRPDGGGVDIRTGDVVEVTAGEFSVTVEIVDITGSVDSAADVVSGQIIGVPYPADVHIEVWRPNGQSRDTQTDEAGNFSLDFGDFDIEQGTDIGIWYVRPDGHMAGIVRSDFQFQPNLTDDSVYGQTTPGARVDLTLSSPLPGLGEGSGVRASPLPGLGEGSGVRAVKATATTWASDDGQFSTDFRDKDGNRVDIAPGDIISGQADGKSATLVLPAPFSAVYDHQANTVCGQAPPGVELEVSLWGYGTRWITVDPQGHYCADFSDSGDPQIWDQGTIALFVADGHRVWLNFGTPSPDLHLQKWGDGHPASGRTYDWILRYRNQGEVLARNVSLVDTLPDGMSFVSESTGLAAVIGNRVIWGLGTVAPGDWVTITLAVRVDADPGTNLENCAELTTTTWERDTGNNRACDRRQAVPDEVDLRIGKGSSPGDPAPGHEYVYWISFNNDRPASALDVRITDTLPVSVTFVSEWHPAGWRVDTSTPGVVVWTREEFPGWYGEYIELKVRVNDDVPVGVQLRNHVEIGTASNDVEPGNNVQDHDAWTREPYVNLWVGKWYANGSPVAGQIYATWVQVENHGNAPATNVVLTDTFPANTTLGKVFRYDWNPATGGYDLEVEFPPDEQGPGWARWNLGGLVNWRQVQMRVDFRIGDNVPPWTELVNRVDVAAAEPDGDPGDNHTEYRFTTQPAGPNVRARKDFNWGELLPGNTLQYWLHIENDGTEPAFGVVFTDTLPEGVTLQGHGFWQEPTVVGDQLVWHVGQMNPSDSHGFWVQVRINDDTPVGTVLTNTIEISTASAEVRHDDNVAEDMRVVGPDLRVEKELVDEPVRPGHQVRYRIRVWNDGQAWARNVVLTDTLPAGCTFAWGPGGYQVHDGVVVWRGFDVPPNWWTEFDIGVDVGRGIPGGTVITNTIEITNDLGDADLTDNAAVVTATVTSPYHIRVQETHNWVDGQVLPNAYVNVTLRDSSGGEKQTINTGADGDGNFSAGFGQDIVPGDTVEVDTEGALIVIEVNRIEGIVNAAAESISGHVYDAVYPADVRAELWIPDAPPPVYGQTDESGDYSLSFAPFDVKSGHQVALWYIRPDGHEVGVVRSALFVRVYPADDNLWGGTAPNTRVDVTLRDQTGHVKGTAQTTSSDNGDWSTDIYTGTQRVEIDDHDTVEVTAGSNSASVFVPRIMLLPDAVHDWLQIVSELPNTRLDVRWDSQPMMENHDLANGVTVSTGPDGGVRLEFGPLGGLDLGINGNLYYYDADGNCVEPWWRAMIASVDPDDFVNDHAQPLYIVGAGFRATPPLAFLGTLGAPPSVVISNVTFISPQLLRVTIPAGTPAGVYYLGVMNPDERIGFLMPAFTIRNPQPAVSSITPASGYWDETVSFTLAGSGFAPGADVALVQGSRVITATDVTVVSATQITGTLDLRGATPGLYNVVVRNTGPGRPTGTLTGGFRVLPRWWTRLPLVVKRAR